MPVGGYKKELEVKIIVYWLVAAEYTNLITKAPPQGNQMTYKCPTLSQEGGGGGLHW